MSKTIKILLTIALASAPARAQEPFNVSARVDRLATLFSDLYGPDGLIVDSLTALPGGATHSAHFASDFQENFSQFTTAFVNELVTIPLPSPASGLTFEFDPTLGVFQRSTQSFGPILAERAETIGGGRVAFGAAFQRFSFDTLENMDLDRIPAVFQHDSAELLGGREDLVVTTNSIEATISQFTSFLTIGVSDNFDVSVAVPIVNNDLRVVSDATIERLGTTDPLTHFYIQSDGSVGNRRVFNAVGRASGLGDVTVRLKSRVAEPLGGDLAFGLDLRIPTGDAMDLLGSGTAGVRPFAVWSTTVENVSPHLNLSYQWNGSSVLEGNPSEGISADFPDEIGYAAGADVSVNSRLTVALDLLGRYVIDSSRARLQDFNALDGVSVFPTIAFGEDSFNSLRGAIGAKISPLDNLLIDVNVLFALDSRGLVDKVTPMVGFEYGF